MSLENMSTRTIRGKKNMKLSQRFYGPFKVLKRIGEVAYYLELPPMTLLHLVFYVSQLKRRVGDPGQVI